jgi:hypothetical protein
MQKCLNDDASYLFNICKKKPWLLLIPFLFTGGGIIILVVSLLCNTTYPCTQQQVDYSLFFGLILCVLSVIYIGVPCCLRCILNGIYYQDTIQVIYKSPIRSIKNIKVSKLKRGIPPSPKSPSPKHALQSFREVYS